MAIARPKSTIPPNRTSPTEHLFNIYYLGLLFTNVLETFALTELLQFLSQNVSDLKNKVTASFYKNSQQIS